VGAVSDRGYSLSLVVNDTIAIDAGCIGFLPSIDDQQRIRHIFLTHSHLDHVASLPIFLDNVYEYGPMCPTVYAGADAIASLKTDFFNNRVWPDFLRLSGEESPFLKFEELRSEVSMEAEGLTITPVELDHVVPSFGFVIDDGSATVGVVCDTLPTARVWGLLNDAPNLAAVFLEASFPNSMQWLADKAGHLTPSTFAAELRKLHSCIPTYAIHIKPAFHDQIVAELNSLEMEHVHIAEPGREYEF
jgi:cAMP phosphodiesterase